MQMKKNSLCLLACFLLFGCSRNLVENAPVLTHVQIIDRNGVNETFSQKERLEVYQKVNFLNAQPYQKVVRVFKRDGEGKVLSHLTTYHDNGEVFQYLEVLGGRAKGEYKEWYENGNIRIISHVMEGIGDLSPDAQTSWIFDGESKVWDPSGNLIAEVFYQKGKLEGESLYYHANGKLSQTIPYKNDVIEGTKKVYDFEGNCVGETEYVGGVRDGISFFSGDKKISKREERFEKSLLDSGKYWDFDGKLTHEILGGSGVRPDYKDGYLAMEYEYLRGKPEGVVKTFRKTGDLESVYHIAGGAKQGEEILYSKEIPVMQINWIDDEIYGTVRTWYPNGKPESEKEMVQNKKHGKYMAWYEDGHLMMIEEYENDVLIHGKYFKKGEEFPQSRVVQGSGIATIFDAKGNFLRKTDYQKGLPSE
jgi:antitoxin component YwqK of YwqJK toxin-antitoxin module